MQPNIFVRDVKLTNRLRAYVEKRTEKLERYMPNMVEMRVDLSEQNARSIDERQIAQLTVRDRHGAILRAEERNGDMFSAIDAVVDKMYRQISRYRGRLRARRRNAVPADVVAWDVPDAELLEQEEEETAQSVPQLARVKRFAMQPMSPDEAIDQMDLLGHDFFVFFNMEQDAINVVYRRRDDTFGLIIPELG